MAEKPHVNHPTDRICMICKERKCIFSNNMYSCSGGCGHSFHSVCHCCMHKLVTAALDALPIEQHLAYNYLPEFV